MSAWKLSILFIYDHVTMWWESQSVREQIEIEIEP